MIGSLKGKVIDKNESYLILDINGVGYKVNTTEEVLNKTIESDVIFLWTHTDIKETSMEIFGFEKKEDQFFFQHLLDVPGVGPRSAIGILNLATTETLQKAIAKENTEYLKQVSGIGKKTAEKMVFTLKEKIKIHEDEDNGELDNDTEAAEALKSLGYSPKDIQEAIKQVSNDSTSEKIKSALRILNDK